MNVIKKIKMRKGPKIVLSTIFIFALVLTTGLFLSKGNIIGKLFADKKENKSISEKIIEDYGENEDDVAFDGLEVSFVDKRGETGDPVDYGVLDSNGSSAKDVYLKIKNKFPTATHINISGASTSGMNVNFENNSIDLSAGNTAGDTIYIAVDYSAPSVSDGGVYSFVAYLNYTFDDVYDGDSSSLKTFSKSIAYAASYKATPSNNYNTITMLNWAVRDGSADINFTMTPNLINANDNFYAKTSFNQGTCNYAKSNGLANSQPSKCNASYTIDMFVNRQVYDDFSDVGFSFNITNSASDSSESLKFDGDPSMSWNDGDSTLPTINSQLSSGIGASGGTGSLAFSGDVPTHTTGSPKVLSIPIDFVEAVSVYRDTYAALAMTVNLYAYTTTSYNNLLNLVTTQEQSGLIDEFTNSGVDLSDYYTALENARKALANPRKTDYEMDNAYNALNTLYNNLISESDKYNANKFMVVNDLFFSGDMSSGTATDSKTHYRVYTANDSYTIPRDLGYFNESTTNKYSVQYTGTADNNYVFNNKYWHINSPADTTDVSNAISDAQTILSEDVRKYTTDSRQTLVNAVAAATDYIDPNVKDEPECDSDFTNIVTEIEDAINNMVVATYTIEYVDDDGETVIQTNTLPYGDPMPNQPANPSKDSTVEYTYTFAGWTDNATGSSNTVVENVTYTATYTATIRAYTIEFLDYDGTQVSSAEVNYGEMPSIPADPERQADAQYTYTFTGWDHEVHTVTGDEYYKAEYSSTLNKYTITFKDYNGDILKQSDVDYGTMPTPPENPTRASSQSTVYTFTGWDDEISSVTGAKIYTAQYSEEPRPYTITFLDDDKETVLYSAEFGYGTVPTYGGETPSKDATAQYTYEFAGWNNELVAVTGPAEYNATYTATVRNYEITFVDYKGDKIGENQHLDYGEMPVVPADPVKPADAQYTYTFTGWSPEVTTVTGNQTYTPTYSQIVNSYNIYFVDADGETILDEQKLEYGATPVYAGETPTKESTAEFSYEFSGWDKEILTVKEDTTYTATYTATKRKYEITFDPNNGEEPTVMEVYYGDTPSYGDDPIKEADAQYTYTFKGWDKTIVPVTGPATYTAGYSQTIRSYTIIFNDEDGTELKRQTLDYGQTPTPPADPTKAATAQYTYTFAGWDFQIATVTGDKTYTATYTSEENKYLIKFVNYDDTVLQSENLVYGSTPVYNGETPTKPSSNTENFTFAGWDSEISTVTGTKTYTATYTSSTRTYTITFVDEDNQVLQSSQYEYGQTPVYSGETPEKDSTAQFDYTFNGWDKVIIPVNEDTTYTVSFTATTRKYTITFNNDNGDELQSSEVEYGQTPTYNGATPTKAATAQYTYTFAGWSPEIASVTGAATYTATYTNSTNSYEIKFVDEDGTELKKETLEYGATPEAPADPTKQSTAQYSYTFAGWSPEIASVTGAQTYTATYNETTRSYLIKFVNYDDSELQSSEIAYGETPVYNGATPTKPSTNTEVYTYTGWDSEISAVTGEKTYKATFSTATRKYTVTFVDENNQELQSSQYEYEATPVYNGATPTKPSTDEYEYTFAGWDKELIPVTEDTTYTVKFTASKRKYTITFNLANGGGSIGVETEYGQMPTPPADPVKPADAEYTYTFTGWSPEMVAVTGEATYTAQYSQAKNKYTIKFVNYDNTELQSSEVEYGETPAYAGEVPTKPSTAEHSYVFANWSPEISSVTGAQTYTATYTETARRYTIKFVNYDDSELQSGELAYGATPEYTGATPTKPSTNTEVFTFAGWDSEISDVTGEKTYKATFTSATRKYTITFKNDDGTELKTEELEYDAEVTPPANPTKEATAEFTYTFAGWSPEVAKVTKDQIYTATYNSTKNKYIIKFVNYDDSELKSEELEYGATPTAPANPTRPADAQYTYVFAGWDSEISTVTGEKTYKATYTNTTNKYTVKFVDENDQELQSEELDYGATPVYSGPAQTKEADVQYTYTFDGWTPSITPVTGDVTYKVRFNPTLRKYTITFKNYDGTVLQTSDVEYGTTPSYTGETPTKPNDGDTEYAFAGWDPEVVSVAGEKVYTATFIEKVKTYQVTFETNGGSEIAGFAVEENKKVTKPTDPTRSGYVFIGWYTTNALETEYDFDTPVTGPVTLYAKWEEEVVDYKIIEGANQSYVVDEAHDLVIKSDGNYVKFIGIKVDGVEVSADCYESAPGSTVVTLKAAYLKTLSKGEHTITFMYRDGEVSTKFTANIVEETTPTTDNPVTGDNVFKYIITLLISMVSILGGRVYYKKKFAKSNC